MSKITRRSYKRKKIIMGVALFGAIGLVSTGFAAWVLSASANAETPANLKVGAVSETNMTFRNLKVYGKSADPDAADPTAEIETSIFSFNPEYNDNSGRVRFGKEDSSEVGERLSLVVRGEITQAQNLGQLKVGFDSIPANLQTAVDSNYIVLPACATSQVDVTYTLSGETVKTAAFEFEIKFQWGSAFGGVNPGVYYDTEGASVNIDTVKTTLTNMHNLLDDIQVKATFVAIPN